MLQTFPMPLVSTGWLAEHLDAPGLVILDTSWYLPVTKRDAEGEYRAEHIPGARYFDLDAISATDTELPHMLPDDATLGRQLGALGIGATSTVVVYDGSGGNLSAARAWWMLRTAGVERVSLLDGGLGRWRAEGRPLTNRVERWSPVSFTSHADRSRVRTRAQVAQALRDGRTQVVDMRAAGRFAGSDPEPRPGLPTGHMPGARNLPYASLVDGEGKALTGDALRARLTTAGLDLERPIIATCGSGVSACTLLLALETLGVKGAALYDGSWTEWATSGEPIVKNS